MYIDFKYGISVLVNIIFCLYYFCTATPCHSTIDDLLQSADALSKFRKMVDHREDLHKHIICGLKVSQEDYDNMYYYKKYGENHISEMILKKVVENHGDRFKVCHLLNIIKKNGHRNIVREVFGWHTGNGGPCAVCTRDLFG